MEQINAWFNQVANNMGWDTAWNVIVKYKTVFKVMFLGYLTHWLPVRTKVAIEHYFAEIHIVTKVVLSVLTGIICYQAYSASFQPFIYFQF